MTRLKVIACFSTFACLSSLQTLNTSSDQYSAIRNSNDNPTDLLTESTRQHLIESDGGRQNHDAENNSKRDRGYSTKERYNEENHDNYAKDSDAHSYDQNADKEKSQYDETDRSNQYHVNEAGVKAAKFAEKEGHKRGHKTKGYHNKFLKDEFHREHKFYDVYHKRGSFKKNGDYRSAFDTNVRGRRRKNYKNSGSNYRNLKKIGHHHNGKQFSKQEGHKWKQGHQSHNNKRTNYGRTGGSNGDKSYKFKRTH